MGFIQGIALVFPLCTVKADNRVTKFMQPLKTVKCCILPKFHTYIISFQLLANPMPLLLSDAACNAVMGAAVAVGGQMLIRPSIPACCGHCSGEMKLI
jgi:hypothetical protein